jgi:hypothetical protein
VGTAWVLTDDCCAAEPGAPRDDRPARHALALPRVAALTSLLVSTPPSAGAITNKLIARFPRSRDAMMSSDDEMVSERSLRAAGFKTGRRVVSAAPATVPEAVPNH